MTLKQLEVFAAIAGTASFSKGADMSCITQSTASQHIRALEEELGIRLFDRGRGGALLTEAGKLFLEGAQKIIADCLESKAAIRRFIGMENIVLRVGASNVPATSLVPAVMGNFFGQFSQVRVEVLQGDSYSTVQKLLDEEIELGIIGKKSEDQRISCQPLAGDLIVCAVSPALAAAGKLEISPEELCRLPLMVREDGSGTQQAVYEALSGVAVNREALRIVAVLGSAEAIRRALVSGIGYAFVSWRSIADELADGKLVTVAVSGLEIARNFYVASRAGRELSPAAAAFRDMLMASES